MAANIERLTGIESSFIINVENSRKIKERIIDKFKTIENVKKEIKSKYCLNELKKQGWIEFKDESNIMQMCIDILDFLKVRDFDAAEKLEEQVLFKKSGTDLKKISLWIARCDEISKKQKINEYNSYNLLLLIKDLKKYAYTKKGIIIEEITKLFNLYGIYFVCEKALSGSKVRGCFKVKNRNPAVYITDNYAGKDSFFFELFHELGHCKSDYNDAKNKVIIDGNKEKEERADNFSLSCMIGEKEWKEIIEKYKDEKILYQISNRYEIPMSFIVGRLAKNKYIKYSDQFYIKNYKN
ncbi:MAG: hypothetical protein Q4G05_03005 [Clostridia bacterium]|nr:hypothetical protein [Clostridia bacterium]